MPAHALGFAEVPFLSITALVADAMLKAGGVKLLGLEPVGNEEILIRIAGDLGAVEASLSHAETFARELGSPIRTTSVPSPDKEFSRVTEHPNSINPLYGGRDYFLPSDYTQPQDTTTMSTNQQAIGILETQGLAAILHATDAMLKAADVTLVGKEKIGAAYVTVIIRGDVSAVAAALEAGKSAVDGLGKLIAAQVIARPHDDLIALLPK